MIRLIRRNRGQATATVGLGFLLLVPPLGMTAACISATLIVVGVIISEEN